MADKDNIRKYGQDRWASGPAMAMINGVIDTVQKIKQTLQQ